MLITTYIGKYYTWPLRLLLLLVRNI